MTGRENRDPVNANMQWGIDNELRAVASVEAITGLLFQDTGERQKHYTNGDYGTTPDGKCGSTGLEVKCPQNLAETVPEHYLPQIQGQCWIAGFDTVVFGQWTYAESRIWTVARCDEYIDAMFDLLKEFREHLINDTEPKRRKKPLMPELTITRI
jgi:hypothetical protein